MEHTDNREKTTATTSGNTIAADQEHSRESERNENLRHHHEEKGHKRGPKLADGEAASLREPLLTPGGVSGYGTNTAPPHPPSQEFSQDLETGGASWDLQPYDYTVPVALPKEGGAPTYAHPSHYLTQDGTQDRILSRGATEDDEEVEESGWSFEAQRRKWARRQRAWIEGLRSSSSVNEEVERHRTHRSASPGVEEDRRLRAGTERHWRSASSSFEPGQSQRGRSQRHLRSVSSGYEHGGRRRAGTEQPQRSASSSNERSGRQRAISARHFRSASSGYDQGGRQRARTSQHLRSASSGYVQGERQKAWAGRLLRSASGGFDHGETRDLEAAVPSDEEDGDDDSTTTDWLRQDHLHEHRKNLSISSLSSAGRNLSLTAEQLIALGIVYIPPLVGENEGAAHPDIQSHPLRSDGNRGAHPLRSGGSVSDQRPEEHPLRSGVDREGHQLRSVQTDKDIEGQPDQDVEGQPLRLGYVTPPSPLGGSDEESRHGQSGMTNMDTQGDENISVKSRSTSRSHSNENGASTPRFETRSHSRRYRDNPAEDDEATHEGDADVDADHTGSNGDNASSHRYGGTIRSDGFGNRRRRSPCIRLGFSEEDEADRRELIQSAANRTTHLNIQSHNYEPDESEVWRAYVAQQHFRNRGQWWTTGKKRAVKRWILTFLVGVIQGIVAFLCNIASRRLSELKFEHVNLLLQDGMAVSPSVIAKSDNGDDFFVGDSEGDDAYPEGDGAASSDASSASASGAAGDASDHHFSFGGSAFLAFLFYQTLYAFLASLFVYFEPVAAGSGIPEIKCFLNGIDLPNVVRVQTLICKVMGVTFSVAAGLPVGKEGPMVHSGAVVAAGISQGRTKFWGVDTSFSKFSDFRNDREKRDFVACGAASGVTSAFGAPIGGVLFSLEEGASYWSTKLTWRAFFCAMITLGTLFWVKNVDSRWGQANFEKLFSFGEFNSLTGEASNFSIWELLLFIIIGCLGGLIGAVFNAANEHLTIWRMKHVNHSKLRRIGEVILVSIVMSTVSFVMPLIWNRCTELPTDMQDWSNQEKNLVDNLVPFRCQAGKEYNEVASLIFADADTAIKQLFHFREAGQDDSSTFSSAALFLFFLPYIVMATVTYGIAVPSGLFVPSLLSGAAFGRLFGHLLHKLDHTNGTFADSGTYALMGAAAVLGGMARMTISLTVILLEATGDMQYVLPLMLTLMAARFTGNVFNEGLYDIHIKLRKIPFLEPEVPSIAEKHEIVAGQVMSTDVKCLRPVERAGVVYDLLKNCSHGTFPIVDTATSGTLYGTASRSMLCTLLQRRAFGSPEVLPELDEYDGGGGGFDNLGPRRLSPLVQWDTIERVYPRYPTIDDVDMREADRQNWLDLRPYANTAPYTVNETASIQRTYRLFRTLGLRFLCVVNYNNQVVGIITRKDLLPEALSESLLRGRYAHMMQLQEDSFHDD